VPLDGFYESKKTATGKQPYARVGRPLPGGLGRVVEELPRLSRSVGQRKVVNREEFVVVGWIDPEGSRPWLGSLLLAYCDPEGRLAYAGRVGTGIDSAELEELWRGLQPLATSEMPLDVPPPRTSRFGSPLVLSRVHWVRPELVIEVKYLTWTDDYLLRQVVYEDLREDKPAAEARRPVPHPKPVAEGPARSTKAARAKTNRRGVT
jgi:ATP-dependent DNA ligase